MDSNFITFNYSQIGASHIENGKPCQDSSMSKSFEGGAYIAVADGHGGSDYVRSDRGSRYAMEAVEKVFDIFITITHNMQELPEGDWKRQLASSVISEWQQLIRKDYDAEPMETNGKPWQSLYGTTLIAAILTAHCFFGMQIGDGKCVDCWIKDSIHHPKQSIPKDSRCIFHYTTSMCDKDAVNEFRFHFRKKRLPSYIAVGTDGIEFGHDTGLHDFYGEMAHHVCYEGVDGAEVLKQILPRKSREGTRDDISVAMIINCTKYRYEQSRCKRFAKL